MKKNEIDIVNIIYTTFSSRKVSAVNENFSKSELELVNSLTPKQRSLYNYCLEQYIKEFTLEEKELIRYVLDFVSVVNGTNDNNK